ncbi:transglutaminase family protein [Pelagibacterium sp.]|uniref:transglutaminase family protein n=1 Tax=Pelagibacterium sp. TaxID=1967288 RepID=UPI003A8D57E2
MRISIRHEFRFAASEGLAHAVQHLLLTPRDTASQTIVEWSIKMAGIDAAASFTDAFGNSAHLVSQHRPEDDLFIAVSGIVETDDTNGVLGRVSGESNLSLFKRFTAQTRPNGNLVNRMKTHAKAGMSRVEILHWLMTRLHEARETTPEDEDDTPDIVAEDHAHVFVAAARGMDIPARFITGYVLGDDDEPARLHAWAEAWDDGLGWIGFDPSVNLCPTPAYVRIACGLDAESTAPVRLAPALERQAADTIRVTQVMMNQQQQQQSGA